MTSGKVWKGGSSGHGKLVFSFVFHLKSFLVPFFRVGRECRRMELSGRTPGRLDTARSIRKNVSRDLLKLGGKTRINRSVVLNRYSIIMSCVTDYRCQTSCPRLQLIHAQTRTIRSFFPLYSEMNYGNLTATGAVGFMLLVLSMPHCHIISFR